MPNKYITSVIEELTRILAPIGMKLEEDKGANVAVWYRERPWKIDSVEIAQKQSCPDRFYVSYLVVLKGTNIPRRIFHGMTLEGFHRGDLEFVTPGRVRGIFSTPARFASAVAKNVADQLHWFDEMDTPEGCLQKLRTGETNGAGAGGKAFDIIEATLKALVAEQPSA